mmetsp:Transcript_59444/g.138465  ORF Transcript_59444/g.138465 Transcript_59444/m.138465 type:complete len:227 (+) Transcript_59444:599-1279(+)
MQRSGSACRPSCTPRCLAPPHPASAVSSSPPDSPTRWLPDPPQPATWTNWTTNSVHRCEASSLLTRRTAALCCPQKTAPACPASTAVPVQSPRSTSCPQNSCTCHLCGMAAAASKSPPTPPYSPSCCTRPPHPGSSTQSPAASTQHSVATVAATVLLHPQEVPPNSAYTSPRAATAEPCSALPAALLATDPELHPHPDSPSSSAAPTVLASSVFACRMRCCIASSP